MLKISLPALTCAQSKCDVNLVKLKSASYGKKEKYIAFFSGRRKCKAGREGLNCVHKRENMNIECTARKA